MRPSKEMTLAVGPRYLLIRTLSLYLDHGSKGTSAQCEVQSPTGYSMLLQVSLILSMFKRVITNHYW